MQLKFVFAVNVAAGVIAAVLSRVMLHCIQACL
jgi:hypothetical protein